MKKLYFLTILLLSALTGFSLIVPVYWYDFGGGLGKGKNGYEFLRQFDGIIGNGGWPEKNVTMRTFHMGGPNETTAYIGRVGYTVMVDLVGHNNLLDVSKQASITGFEIYDNSFAPDDTVFIYNYDAVMANPDPAYRYYHMARPDSLMTPIATLRCNNGAGFGNFWRTVSVTTSARYLMYRVTGTDRGYGISFCNPGEMRINGTPYGGSVTPINFNNPQGYVKKPLGQIIGTNNVTALDTVGGWYDSEGNLRTYSGTDWWDPQTVDHPFNMFNGDFFGDNNITNRQMRYLRRIRNAYTYNSYRGPNGRVLAYKPGLKESSKGAFWDNVGDDPTDPMKQKRAARFAKAFAGRFGTNTSFPVSSYWYNNTSLPGAGLDIYKGLEPLNEAENDLAGNVSPLFYFAISTAMYDGWEGRVEANTGVQAADPNFDLIAMGTVEMDMNWYLTLWFLTQTCRTDKKFVWSHINIHHYSTDLDSVTYIVGTLASRVGIRGRTAERDSIYQRMTKFADSMRSIIPGVKIMVSENGRDQVPNPAPDEASASVWTLFSIPPMVGLTTDQAKATLTLRDELIWGASRFDIYSQYWLSGGVLLSSENPVTFATSHLLTGWPQPDEISLSYWIRVFRDQHLRNYVVDSVYNIGHNAVCEIRWRHKDNPDSLCNTVWRGVRDGSTSIYNVHVGSDVTVAKKIVPVFGSAFGTTSTVVAAGGVIPITATQSVQMFKYSSAASLPAPYNYFIKKKGKRQVFAEE